MASNGDLFKGFLAGGLVGLAAGILFAPKSGRDMREELMSEGDDLLGKAKGELEKIKSELGDLRDKITDTIDRGKAVFEQAQSDEELAFEAEINSMDDEAEEKPAPKKATTSKKSAAKKA
jgi:gas vesicle protein